MTNRDGADIQEARKYVTSKQGNMTNAANIANNNSSGSSFSSSSNSQFNNSVDAGLNSLSSASVSNSKPMAATIEEARKLNSNQGSGSMK